MLILYTSERKQQKRQRPSLLKFKLRKIVIELFSTKQVIEHQLIIKKILIVEFDK